jgi:antirestriction protein
MEQIKREETKHGVYFANLSEYNNGRMVGGWLYPLDYDSFDSFYIAIKEVTRNADEVAVHDYDDFPNIDNEVLFKYMANQHDYSIDLVEEAENSYINTYEDFQKFANEYADEEIINNVNKEAQQFVFSNFDYESYAYDLRHSFDSFKLSTYEVAIFHQS